MARDDPGRDVTLLVGLQVLVFEVGGLFFEPVRLGAFVEQHVERLLDVVRVELLFEVYDVVVFLFRAFLDRRGNDRNCDNIHGVLFYEKLIVDLDIDFGHNVDIDVVVFEIDLFYEIGLVVEVVVVGHHGSFRGRGASRW